MDWLRPIELRPKWRTLGSERERCGHVAVDTPDVVRDGDLSTVMSLREHQQNEPVSGYGPRSYCLCRQSTFSAGPNGTLYSLSESETVPYPAYLLKRR